MKKIYMVALFGILFSVFIISTVYAGPGTPSSTVTPSDEIDLIDDATINKSIKDEYTIQGKWFVADKIALVNIYKSNNVWNGRIIWLKEPIETDPKSPAYGKEAIDFRNPDPAKQKRLIVGIAMLENFKWNGKKFVGGSIYDPDLGKTYRCQMAFKDKNTLKIRGYIGVPILGRTEIWKRETASLKQ